MGKYKGVYPSSKYKDMFVATIYLRGKAVPIGTVYHSEREAAIIYDKVAIKYGKPTNILKKKT